MTGNRTHSILTFVPSKDFETSTSFYRALGFEVNNDDDVRHCSSGDAAFLLQDFYVRAWANNFMMAMHVDDAQSWVDKAQELTSEYPETRTQDPKLEDFGLIVGHFWDPTGVLWHITQSP